MSNTITRRAALTGTAAGAAAIVAGTAPAIALDDDRAEWLALWRDHLEKERLANEAFERREDAGIEARRQYPTPPAILQHRKNGKLVLDFRGEPAAITRDHMEQYHEAMVSAWGDHRVYGSQVAQRHEERRAALKAYKAACRRVDRRFGVPALKAAEKAAGQADELARDAITERPAHSIVGIAVKLAYWVRFDGASPMLSATLDDAPREHRAVIMAYRDAARFAGLPEDMYAEGLS